ncbi:ATP-dependent helicase HrpB [Nitriliruptoraceae bacterium ZYF776]|nr:ATP-dependent helicase HrpB [Profundirhabdus halotolerans]
MADDPLPIEAVLRPLRAALTGRGLAVLEAPPGAGKTTRVPLDLLAHEVFAGRLLLLEPRRVAARAAARRLAEQLGEPVGRTVGVTTRDDRRTSAATRIEVVTDGILLRRLQRDPSLPGVGLVVFDEFHERRLETDLGLAFALEVRGALRDDLQLLVTSATLDGDAVARLLARGDDGGAPVPVVRAEGRVHPVEVTHLDGPGPGDGVVHATVEAVGRALADGEGDVLVFLPGVREIGEVVRRVADRHPDVAVLPLHGGLPADEQDRALAPVPGRRRVVVSTDLAETSLTVPGVRTVVDAGLAREPRFDPATGMSGLVTVPASRGSAEQRAGRAGRLGPGRALRLWPAAQHPRREALPRPAIATDDLTGAALEVAVWGADVADLALLDAPDPAAWDRAMTTLHELGAVDTAGRPTAHGRQLASLPLHPRLAHLVRRGHDDGHGALACDLAAVLGDRDPLRGPGVGVDLVARVTVLRGGPAPRGASPRRRALEAARREAGRLRRLVDAGTDHGPVAPEVVGRLVALGWPDRIAAARRDRRGAFVLANGRGATVRANDELAGERYLVVADVDRGGAGGERGRGGVGRDAAEARIHLAAAVDRDDLEVVLADRIEVDDHVAWRDGDVRAERRHRIGAVTLRRAPLATPSADALLDALLDGLAREGLELLGWRREDRQLQARLTLLHRTLGAPWPAVDDDALLADLAARVGPFLLRARRRADLARVRVADLLLAAAPPTAAADLDRLAPTHLGVPSGSRKRLDYDAGGGRPVLAVKLQELFGATRTPSVVDGRVPVVVHLLSPAGRPVQITDDLPSFWANGYAAVRAELRGRYPKHPWPQDPTTATPTARTTRRR